MPNETTATVIHQPFRLATSFLVGVTIGGALIALAGDIHQYNSTVTYCAMAFY